MATERYAIWRGEFASRGDDSRWSVTLLEKRSSAPATVGELRFSARQPLVIEWPETAKEDVLQGSLLTLRLQSPGDRTYTDLYTIEAGRISCEVRREGVLYWQGALDPELYNEPYNSLADYEVSLTFSDLGILKRLKYDLSGIQTVRSIVQDALLRAGLPVPVRTDYVSTVMANGLELTGSVGVRSENFTDEEGEVSTLDAVVEGVLQPLGLHLIQRNGQMWLYDLNGLYHNGAVRQLRWHDSDQELSVDKVVQKVTVRFSPYGGAVLDSEAAWTGPTKAVGISGVSQLADGVRAEAIYPDYGSGGAAAQGTGGGSNGSSENDYVDFVMFTSGSTSDGVGVAKGDDCQYFHIEKVYGGESCDGVCLGYVSGRQSKDSGCEQIGHGMAFSFGSGSGVEDGSRVVLKTYRQWLPKLPAEIRGQYRLRMTLECLLDARYNPFEDGGDNNEGVRHQWVKEHANVVQVWFSAVMYDAEGQELCWYYNQDIAYSHEAPGSYLSSDIGRTLGAWLTGEHVSPNGLLSWYDGGSDESSRWNESGVGGWKTNRHTVGLLHLSGLDKSFLSESEGQWLPYPPVGGWLEIKVYGCCECWDLGKNSYSQVTSDFCRSLRWVLFKAPEVTLYRAGRPNEEVEDSDEIIYEGVVNAAAAEELSIDTICGTSREHLPTARGVYIDVQTGEQVMQLLRQGVVDVAEQLLIGSFYSQYGSRHVKLTGTMDQLLGDLCVYSEAMQEAGKRLLMVSDVQDADAGTSKAVVVELSGDEYRKMSDE